MSGKLHRQNHEDTRVDENPDHSVKTVSSLKAPGQEHSPGWKVNMALPPSGDEESGSNKKTHKRMVHNAVERRRKVKITNHIHILAKLLPNKDGKRWSKNETLEKAVEYIHEIKNAHDKMMMGKLDEAHAAELTRMKRRIEELEERNSTYAKLIKIAGISTKGDCKASSWDPESLGEKINQELITSESNKEIVILDDDDECGLADTKLKNSTCKSLNGKSGNKICKAESSTKETISTVNSTASVGEANKQRNDNGPLNPSSCLPCGQNNGMLICTGSEQLSMNLCQDATSNVRSTVHRPLINSNSVTPNENAASSSTEINQSVNTTTASVKPPECSTAVPAIQESVITNSGVNGSVTAVTRSLPGAPIMSTNQISTGINQHQTVVPQMPLLNIGGTMNLMQGSMHQLITINDQGMPMLQMVTGPPQMGSGQLIMNGTSTQNLLVMGNSPASAPTAMNAMNSGINSVGMNAQTFHAHNVQTGQPQNFLQTDAGLFHQTVCGNQLMGQTQCLSNLPGTIQQLQSANPINPQMQLLTSSMNPQITPHMISAQNGGMMLGTTMQGPQQQPHNNSNTLLSVNSTSNSSNLPSALMLPNGQIIPVVREPSLMYPSSASISGNMHISAAPSNVPHAVFSSSQSCQTQTGVCTTLATLNGRPLTSSCEFAPVVSCSAPNGSVTQANKVAGPAVEGQLHNLIAQVTGEQAIMQNRPLTTGMTSLRRTSSSGNFGERSLAVTASSTSGTATDVSAMQGKMLDTTSTTSSSCPSKTQTSSGTKSVPNTSKKPKVTTKRAQRTIKPKPAQATASTTSSPSSSSIQSTTSPITGLSSAPVATCKDPSPPAAAASSASTTINFSNHFSPASNLPPNSKNSTSCADYLSSTSSPDTITSSSTTKTSTKKQGNCRPSNIINDILAQATESIFSNSISDISSSPNPHYFGNSGSNSNSSHVIFMQDVADDVECSAKKGHKPPSFTSALIMDASKNTLANVGSSNEQNDDVDMMDVSSESLQIAKSRQHATDVLSDLVGGVYKTTNRESPGAASLSSVSTGNIPSACSTFDSAFGLRNPTTSAPSKTSTKEGSCAVTRTDATSSVLSVSLPEMGLSGSIASSNSGQPDAGSNINLNNPLNTVCGAAGKEKRSCSDELPNSKRNRPSCLTLECSSVSGDHPVKEIGTATSKSGPEGLTSAIPTLTADSYNTAAASNSVNFVSISQLASSASNVITTTSTSLGTFVNSMLPNIAPFSIDTGISNENSPICSISPLLSSPNKSSDLAFTLGSAISDLPRPDEPPFLGKSPSSGGNYAGIVPDGSHLVPTSSPFTSVPHSFGLATTLSSSSSATFYVPELGHNVVSTSSTQSGFGSMSYSGPMGMQRANFNGISMVPSSSIPTTSTNSFLDKNQKLHPLHYSDRQGEMRAQGLIPVSIHNSPSQVSSRHPPEFTSGHLNATLASNNLHFPPSHLPLPIAPFSQAYSMPLSHQSSRTADPNLNISHNDANKSKSNSQSRPSINSADGVTQHNGIMSPPGMSHNQMQRPGSMHQIRPILDPMIPGFGPSQLRQPQNYPPQRMHSLNRQSPQGGATAPSPKMPEVHGHSPISNRGPATPARNTSNVSPKPNLPAAQGHVSRSHPVPSPGRNPQPSTPVSSPATFVPRRSPNVSAGESPMITSYAAENSSLQNSLREPNFQPGQKQLTHLPIASSMNTTSRAVISYSAESLIQTQPNSRPNCAREGHPVGRQPVLGHNGSNSLSCPTSNSLQFVQGAGNRHSREDIHQSGFPYFPPFQQHSTAEQMALPPPPPHPGGNALKHAPVQNHVGGNKTCVMRGTPESAQAIQSQPNFSFSLLPQHSQAGAEANQQQLLQPHQQQGSGQEVMRHNNSYLSMGNYGGQGPTPVSMPLATGLQVAVHKDSPMSKPPMAFPCMPPFPHNQSSAGQVPNIRQTANNSFLPQNGIACNGMNFPEMYAMQNLRTDGVNPGGQPVAGGNGQGAEKTGNAPYKSRNGSNSKQDGAATTKSSKSKQQSRKKQQQQHHQYSVEEVNLSNSIFETGRSMTPYFAIPNLSPPRNEVPTYIHNTNPLFNAPQRALAPNGPQQPKGADLGTPYSTLFTPRTQSSLNLNFQSPGFGGFGNGGMSNQMPSHGSGVNVAGHVPNFNLSNIFPDINNSNEGISMSPIKFHHGNHILPPPQPGMDHNLQHHHQSGSLYHKRGHPSPVIHNGMTINSLLGHNPHTFDGRPQVPMGINNSMTTPFHGHSHTPSFSNVIPTLNFSMHEH